METPESMERMLRQRLVPRGFTDRGMSGMEALIDGLAGVEGGGRKKSRKPWMFGIAASLAMAAVISWSVSRMGDEAVAEIAALGPVVSLVSESEAVVAAEKADAYLSDDDGTLLQGWYVEVLSEEMFHDGETGEVVKVRQPRDELVLVPVSTF